MPRPAQQYKNRVLAVLPESEIARLRPHLLPVNLKVRTRLLNGKPPTYAYFLEEGLASVVLDMENGSTVEVGIVGRDGIVGLPYLLGGDRMPGQTFIQVKGSGFRIDAKHLKKEFERPGELRRHLQRYLLGNLVQTAQNAACNRKHNVAQRMARWLLACHDRLQSDQMALQQVFLAQMLGTPRTTVTLAAGILRKAGLIKYSRGVLVITNRPKLEKTACECHRVVRNEFLRLGLL